MKCWYTLLALSLLASCSDTPEPAPQPERGTVEVVVGTGPRIGFGPLSRTELAEDGVTVRWSVGDRMALWAATADGTPAFAAVPFTLWHYDATFGRAKFRGDMPRMEPGTYTYYAVSPLPASVEGTLASYDIPAVQDGTFDGSCDVMVAAPAEGDALTEGDHSDAVRFAFRHKVHILKIRIPENALGEAITGLEIAFPQPVAGRLTVDAADPEADPVLSDGSNTLTLSFAEPLGEHAVVYAVIAPVEIPQDERITLTALGSTRYSKPGILFGKHFAAGHTTPVALHVPEAEADYTALQLHLENTGETTLGERITSFTLTADRPVFDNGESTRTFAVTEAGDYFLRYRNLPDGLAGTPVRVAFESENAVVSGSFTMPESFLTGETNPAATLSVPCLLDEDFSGVKGFSNHDNAGGGTTIDTYTDAIGLDQYNLPGWSATRCGAEEGNAFRICARTEDAWIACPRYHGRLDSAPLSGIKPGKTVRVRVTFDYSINISWDKHKPLVAYGYHTTQGLINSINSGSTALDNPVVRDLTGTGGSYSSINQHASYVIEQCTPNHRLAWDIYSANRKTGNSNGWLYLDNIRVTIE